MILKKIRLFLLITIYIIINACGGSDYTPVYFQPQTPQEANNVDPNTSIATGDINCQVMYTAQLCVLIKGDNIEVGLNSDDPLCVELDPFPIHINSNSVSIKGNEFPEFIFEGNGLPAPITINAKGNSDGSDNIATGSIASDGHMTINDLALYIDIVGTIAEIGKFTLSTSDTDNLDFLDGISGSPPNAAGAMTLVSAYTLESFNIQEADDVLLGASLHIVFSGSISPSLNECQGDTIEDKINISKIYQQPDGSSYESSIADDAILLVSNGTFIPSSNLDIGANYESTAQFKITNISSQPVEMTIPPIIGPFYIQPSNASNYIPSNQSIILKITFKPTINTVQESGLIQEEVTIAGKRLFIQATAIDKQSMGDIVPIDSEGQVQDKPNDYIDIGNSVLASNTQKKFFKCTEITCNDTQAWHNCMPCDERDKLNCTLLTISNDYYPLNEVTSDCQLKYPDKTPLATIDLQGNSSISLDAQNQILMIRNTGVTPMTITDIRIKDILSSQSTGEFSLPKHALIVSTSYAKIKDQMSLTQNNTSATSSSQKLPITLPPYIADYNTTALYIIVSYTPKDLYGANGYQAGIGNKVKDQAILEISTAEKKIESILSGTTSILDIPDMEIFIKTSSGAKQISHQMDFPIKGITAQTEDLAVPLFINISGNSQNAYRITSISITDHDASSFQWLDTKQKINSVQPESDKGLRCSIPVMDNDSGQMIDENFNLNPVSLGSNGFLITPGMYTKETMPLFGCINFHRESSQDFSKRLYRSTINIQATQLDSNNNPAKNTDGSIITSTYSFNILAAISPFKGKYVLRITQSMAAILNKRNPALSAIYAKHDIQDRIDNGELKNSDLQIFTSALILDPFDEETITDSSGQEVVTIPGDGITAVFRSIDTHPVDHDYSESWLFDYAHLLHDESLPDGQRGSFDDYPNIPSDAKLNTWRIFTGTLSYPGPVPPKGMTSPDLPRDCITIDPCDKNQHKLFTEQGLQNGKGACAFFYASGGRYDSPAFHTESSMPGGEYDKLCNNIGEKQHLFDMNTGHYSVDGSITFEDVGLRFFGPTFIHNSFGPFDNIEDPMDAIFHMSFTTDMLKPKEFDHEYVTLPDERIDINKEEYKIFLDDPNNSTSLCANNMNNRTILGETADSWRFFEGLLFEDAAGQIPNGCPSKKDDYNGGAAFIRGKSIDFDTGNMTLASAAKFGSNKELSFAFKDIMMFIILNGWICDPNGSEEQFEGSLCYSHELNERDAGSQKSIIRPN